VGAVQALRSDLHGKSSETAEGKQVSEKNCVVPLNSTFSRLTEQFETFQKEMKIQ